MRRALVLALVLGGLGAHEPAAAAVCPGLIPAPAAAAPAWPPPAEPGAFDFAHFGEGHWNEGQGPKTMPILVQELVAHAPRFVAFSSDMADIGNAPPLTCFRMVMDPLLGAGIHWFDSPGNHDRTAIGPGGVLSTEIGPYREVFAGMARPWGDGPHPGPGFVLPAGEPEDGPGASTHYFLDYGPPGDPAMRLIALDNSRHSLTASDLDQYPAVGPTSTDASQFAFLTRAAGTGLLTFAMMHEPTQDPRDITNVHPISYNHTMAKGLTADNAVFDALAYAHGVDGVLLGHIQGNVVYGFGDVRYFVDGGGGGSPYALRETGTDTGYFYGFRLFRLSRHDGSWSFRSYFVPLVDHIDLAAPAGPQPVGSKLQLTATAVQPFEPSLPGRFGLLTNEQIRLALRPPDPSRIDASTVPHLAYMWSTSDPGVLAPLADAANDPVDDPSFDVRTMTTSGRFRAVAAGTARVTVATGTHTESALVTVS